VVAGGAGGYQAAGADGPHGFHIVAGQVVGVFARSWVEPIAEVLQNLGSRHAWVVHGADGQDELTTTTTTTVAELKDGDNTIFDVLPEDAGPCAKLSDLKGGDASVTAGRRGVLRRAGSP
jgi:anthranilate phosphoribosyltransferase